MLCRCHRTSPLSTKSRKILVRVRERSEDSGGEADGNTEALLVSFAFEMLAIPDALSTNPAAFGMRLRSWRRIPLKFPVLPDEEKRDGSADACGRGGGGGGGGGGCVDGVARGGGGGGTLSALENRKYESMLLLAPATESTVSASVDCSSNIINRYVA